MKTIVLQKENLINAGKMGTDLSADIDSDPMLVESFTTMGLSLNWSGTFNGSFSLAISNDTDPSAVYAHQIVSSVVNVSAGLYLGQTGYTYSIPNLSYRWMRLSYVFTSGTGTLVTCDSILKGY